MTLAGKRVLITGANGGLGLETSHRVLAEGAHLTLACRTLDKAQQALETVTRTAGVSHDQAVAAGGFDMMVPSTAATAVAGLPDAPYDVVFLQAGGWVWADDVQTVRLADRDIEASVVKNVVGAHATLAALARSGRLAEGCRVVIIGGEGSRGIPGGITKPEFADLADFERYLAGDWTGRSAYVPVDALGVAKLCAALWAQHLARTADDLEVVWFTPGFIAGTGGTRGMPAWKETLMQRVAFPLLVWFGKAQWPAAAAAKCVDCLAGRVGKNGDLLGAPEGTALGPLTDQKPMQVHFTDRDFQRAVWDLCVAVAGEIETPTSARRIA